MTFDGKDELHKIRRQLDARAKASVPAAPASRKVAQAALACCLPRAIF